MSTLFYFLCSGMAALALLLILPPLLRPETAPAELDDTTMTERRKALKQALDSGVLDKTEYQSKLAQLGKSSSSATVKSSRLFPLVLAILIPLAAAGLYRELGAPMALDPSLQTAAVSGQRLTRPGETPPAPAPAPAGEEAAPPSMDQAVAGLAERMRNSPDDLEGWLLLGRAYRTMENFEASKVALSNAYRLAPDDSDVMVEYGNALALASDGRRIGGEALMLIQRAVAQTPDHQRGQWLLGVSSMQAGVPSEAVTIWERLLTQLEGEARASLLSQIESARRDAGLPPSEFASEAQSAAAASADPAPQIAAAPVAAATSGATTSAAPAASASAVGGPRLVINVDIDPALRGRVGASDVLFVYARAAEGPRMPLAIQRLPAGNLPVQVILDDSTSMMPTLKLSTMPQVVVGARISRSGQAIAQSGDLETLSAPMSNLSTEPVTLRIDSVVP